MLLGLCLHPPPLPTHVCIGNTLAHTQNPATKYISYVSTDHMNYETNKKTQRIQQMYYKTFYFSSKTGRFWEAQSILPSKCFFNPGYNQSALLIVCWSTSLEKEAFKSTYSNRICHAPVSTNWAHQQEQHNTVMCFVVLCCSICCSALMYLPQMTGH